MTQAEVLTIFLQDIGEPYATGSRLDFLNLALEGAIEEIKRAGIVLPSTNNYTVSDANLIRVYAAYFVRGRNSKEPMPPQLRRLLHDRLLSEKMKEADDAI